MTRLDPIDQINMFGMTIEEIDRAVARRTDDPLMFATSILSDAQEIMAIDPENGPLAARQMINVAKYIITTFRRQNNIR